MLMRNVGIHLPNQLRRGVRIEVGSGGVELRLLLWLRVVLWGRGGGAGRGPAVIEVYGPGVCDACMTEGGVGLIVSIETFCIGVRMNYCIIMKHST